MKRSCMHTASTNPGRRNLLLNPPKSPSKRKRRKAKQSMKAKHPVVA